MAKKTSDREQKRIARHDRIRKGLVGTPTRPRLCVHRSLTNFYAQIIDDTQGKTLFGMSTRDKGVKERVKGKGSNVQAATAFGEIFAAEAKNRGITTVCFDRAGYLYHGRVKAFAEAARQHGLVF